MSPIASSAVQPDRGASRRLATGATALACGIGLTLVFWLPLWQGGGLIGGDLYPYYFPQKLFLAERLAAGEFPLWNNRTGHGYPILGESQTGALYPLHLVLYRALSLNAAYNATHILHYVLAFFFMWLYARRFGLAMPGALLAALVYTYGWFPARSCLEWAIIGGAWLPACLWSVETFLQTRLWRYAFALAGFLCLQLLPGHFNLGFITQLAIIAYVPGRLWWARERLLPSGAKVGTAGADNAGSRPLAASAFVAAALLAGFALSAAQLLPTLELKRQSQRSTVEGEYEPSYGHIPPLYWSQVVAPWIWYAPDVDRDEALSNLRLLASPAATNQVEAHLYFGLIPVLLMLGGLAAWRWWGKPFDRRFRLWMLIGLAALLYTSGWFLPLTRHVPGFSYFTGPGRFGIVTTVAVALAAGNVLDRLMGISKPLVRLLLVLGVFASTTADLWLVSRLVRYSGIVDPPPVSLREHSIVGRILADHGAPARVFAPGANLANLIGVAATPVYLGIGPDAYFDPERRMPAPTPEQEEAARLSGMLAAAPGQVEWLQRAGVTHVLSFETPDPREWPVDPVWEGHDRFLNFAWARPNLPIFLSRLRDSRGRTAWLDGAAGTADVTRYEANRVVIDATSGSGGRLVLTDLAFPGWTASIDGRPAPAHVVDGMYRAVDVPAGRHVVEWRYRPASVYWGALISLGTLMLLAALAHVRYWHPQWLRAIRV